MEVNSVIVGGEWSDSRSGRFTPVERTSGKHSVGGRTGIRSSLDAVVKRKTSASG
jgi:hypothetical protein